MEGRGTHEGRSHAIYHTYLKLTLFLTVYLQNLFKIYYLLPWPLEWRMPARTARASSYKVLSPVSRSTSKENYVPDMPQVLEANLPGGPGEPSRSGAMEAGICVALH